MKSYFLGVLLLFPCCTYASDAASQCRNHFLHGQYFVAEESCLAAAEEGDADAKKWLALMYTKGKGVKQDFKKAFYWRREAAKRGDSNSLYHLGRLYQLGHGVGQDFPMARYWYKKSAGNGDMNGVYALGNMYRKGFGGLVDIPRAYACYIVAAEKNFQLAIQAIQDLEQSMTAEQKAEGDRLVREGLYSNDP